MSGWVDGWVGGEEKNEINAVLISGEVEVEVLVELSNQGCKKMGTAVPVVLRKV